MVSAAGGWTAWSDRDADGAYRLVLRAPDGAISRPAVEPRRVPFDVHLGFDALGAPRASYSRCAHEPALHGGADPAAAGGLPQYATGRGCLVHQLDVVSGTELLPYPLVRGVLPAQAGTAMAFVRRAGRRAEVVFTDLSSGATRVLQRGPVRRAAPLAAQGPTSLDTDGRRTTWAWRLRDPRAGTFDSRVFVEGPGERRPTLVAAATNTSDTPFVTVFTPSLGAGGVHYLISFGRGLCERRWASRSTTPAYGLQRSAAPRGPVSAAVDGARLVVAEVDGSGGGEILEFGPRPFTAGAEPGELCG